MSETHQDIDIFRRMTPAAKWQLISGMHHQARRWKRAALKSQHPDWSEAQLDQTVRELFLYGTD